MTRIRVIAAGLTVAVGLPLTGCARPTDMQPTAAHLAPPGPDVLADIVDQAYGTPQQRAAGRERQFYAWQAALGACMVDKGAEFEAPPYASPGLDSQKAGPGDILAFAPHREHFDIGTRVVNVATTGEQSNPVLAKLTGPAAETWIRIQMECEPATKATEELAVPPAVLTATAKLHRELADIQQELAPGLVAAYRTCMAGRGLPADDLPDAMNIAGQKYPNVDTGRPSNPTELPGWAAGVAFERQVAAADWQCRGQDATRVVNASGEKLTAWAGQHQAELTAAAAAWAAMPALRDTAKADAGKLRGK